MKKFKNFNLRSYVAFFVMLIITGVLIGFVVERWVHTPEKKQPVSPQGLLMLPSTMPEAHFNL